MTDGVRSARLAAALSIAILAALAPAEAAAHDRPLYAGFGGGPYLYLDCCRVHGRVQGEFGIHFSGNDSGFFLAFEGISSFGDDYLLFFGGLRIGADIEVHGRHDFAVMLRPSGLIGFGWHGYRGSGGDWPFLVAQPAFDLRFVFAHRVIALWIRPVAFDFMFYWNRNPDGRDWYIGAAYQFLMGIDFQFG